MRLPRSALLLPTLLAACAGTALAAESIDVGSPRLRLSTSLASPPAADPGTATPTFTERTRQPVEELQAARVARERELLLAMDSAARQQRTMDDLEARLARARSERTMNPLVFGLLLALAAVGAGVAALWWKLRRGSGRRIAPAGPQASS